ncbi:MAG: 50S ribosomal protein L22 [Coriobacteriia bacterium]|nr:50S ribosomal protein L22 [Coriobacteriia bacterium]
MEVKAQAKYIRISPRKARIVVDQIRGKKVEDARLALRFITRSAAEIVETTLNSAVANAEDQHHLRAESLVISKAYVDEGPTIKRYRPRAKGAASHINKRTCHITIIVSNGKDDEKKAKSAPKKIETEKKEAPKKETTASKKPAAKKSTAAKKPAAKKPAANKTTAAKKTTTAKKPAAKKTTTKKEA